MTKATMKFSFTRVIASAILMTAFVLGGCAKKQIPVVVAGPSCILPTGVNLTEAVSLTKDNLTHPECQPQFEAYFHRLLEIAAGDPDPENKRRFSDFLVWTKSEGILTMVQSKEYYNRYFNTTFMALPDDYNVCSSAPKKDDIIKAMEAELRQKELGLMKACADKETYYSAHEQFESVLLVLDAVCLACEQGRK